MTKVLVDRELVAQWRKTLAESSPEDCTIQQYNKALHGMDAALAAPQAPAPEQAEPEAKQGWLRYEKLRKLSPQQFSELHKRNLRGEFFDSLVDALPEPSTPKPWMPLPPTGDKK